MIPLDSPSRSPVLRPSRAQRDLARALYATVKDLPIVSPHGHTDPQWFADNDAVHQRVGAVHHARPLRVPHALQPGRRARGPRRSRARDGGAGRARRAQDLAHVRRALPPVPRHADAHVARPRVPRGLRHPRAADAGIRRPRTSTASTRALAKPEFRPRALFERFNIEVLATTESPLDPLAHHAKIRAQRLAGPRVTAYRPDPVVDPEFDGFARQRRAASARSPARTPRRWRGYLAAHRKRRAFFKSMGATSTDHGHPTAQHRRPDAPASASALFDRALAGTIDAGRGRDCSAARC